jgi:hypothetical protein
VELLKKKASNLQELKYLIVKKELTFDVSAAKTFSFL